MGKCVKCHKNYNQCYCKNYYSNDVDHEHGLYIGNEKSKPNKNYRRSSENGHMHVHVHVDDKKSYRDKDCKRKYKKSSNMNTYGLVGVDSDYESDENICSNNKTYNSNINETEWSDIKLNNLSISKNLYIGTAIPPKIDACAKNNISLGKDSLDTLTIGNRNIVIGYQSGQQITSGENNLIYGYRSEPSSGSSMNEILIGNNIVGKGADYAIIGNSNTRGLYISQDGRADLYALNIISPSDKRLKKNIIEIKFGLNFICKLNPVCYQWIDTTVSGNKIHQGLIAQEVKELIEDEDENIDKTKIVEYNKKEDMYRINYMELISPLIKSVQELKAENDSLKKIVKKQNNDIFNLISRFDSFEKKYK